MKLAWSNYCLDFSKKTCVMGILNVTPDSFSDSGAYFSRDAAIEHGIRMAEEGADIIMVKPALGYQDIIYRLKSELNFPTACYSVSGEYSMLKLAAAKGYFAEENVVLEMLSGFKRSGADLIISYYAAEAAEWLKK